MMIRILKTQNLSYSVIQSCLKNHSLIGSLDQLSSRQFILWMQMKYARSYSQRKNGQQQSILLEMAERTEKQNRYNKMKQFLNIDSKAEEERLAEFQKQAKLKERAFLEVKITGVPTVIRALIPSLYLNKYHSYSGILFHPTPIEWYYEVECPFKTSKAYDRLCLKLNVPYYLVTGFCGLQALLKLCEVTEVGCSLYSYYPDEQAVNELFEVVAQKVNNLEKEDLMKLILYRYTLKDFSVKCYKKVVSKFMISMNGDKYSLSDLLNFLDQLKQVDTSIFTGSESAEFEKVTRKIWNHISRRPDSISLNLLRRLYCMAPANHLTVFSVLNKVLKDNLDMMDICDVFLILKEIQTRTDSIEDMAIVSVWLERNLNTISITDLETLLPSFLESQYINPLLFKIIPKLMLSRSMMKDISTPVLIQILQYCTLGKHYDETILEIVCDHYIKDKQGYCSQQLHSLLKAIGTLNFVPVRQREFFTKVELHLMENFYNIDVLTLLEMIVDLIYIDKVAVNFRPYIFAPLFLGIVTEMGTEDRIKATRCVRIIERAFSARGFKPKLSLPVDQDINWTNVERNTHAVILPEFTRILEDASHVQEKARPTGSDTYLELQYNVLAEKASMPANFHDNDKLAFLVMTDSSFCKNNKDHMLGEEMANIRLLQENGLTVVWVHNNKLEELNKENKLSSFVKSLFLQILETADEHLPGSTRVTEDPVSEEESEDEEDGIEDI